VCVCVCATTAPPCSASASSSLSQLVASDSDPGVRLHEEHDTNESSIHETVHLLDPASLQEDE
jgi:hypothetical protein